MSTQAPMKEVLCRGCNNWFKAKAYEKRQCCSPECTHKIRSEITHRRVGYTSQVAVICQVCHEPFYVISTHAKQHKYCANCTPARRNIEKEEAIKALYLSGKTTREIAQQYQISWQRVSQYLKRAGCKTKRGPRSKRA